MSKVYKGYELLKAITNREIKGNTKFINNYNNEIIIYKGGDKLRWLIDDTEVEACYFINTEFELIEDETINIDSIEEIYFLHTLNDYSNEILAKKIEKILQTQNKTIKAVKQLNKEIKSIKENM